MGLALKDYLDRFDIKLLVAGIETIVPDLLKERKDGLTKVDNPGQYVVRIATDYLNALVPANMVYGEIEETRKLDGKASLPFLGGVKIGAGLSKAKKAVTVITEVKCRVLDVKNGARYPNGIFSDLTALKRFQDARREEGVEGHQRQVLRVPVLVCDEVHVHFRRHD